MMDYTGERIIPKENQGSIKEHQMLYERVYPHVAGKKVLDIACGVGWGSYNIAQKSLYVIGIDISPDAVAYATEEYVADNLIFRQGSILNIPLEDSSVEVVSSIETFEHVKRYEIGTLISEVHRVLTPTGTWVFSTPSGEKFPYQPKDESEYQGWHFWHYTKPELIELLQEHFYIEIEMVNCQFVVIARKKLLTTEKKGKGMSREKTVEVLLRRALVYCERMDDSPQRFRVVQQTIDELHELVKTRMENPEATPDCSIEEL